MTKQAYMESTLCYTNPTLPVEQPAPEHKSHPVQDKKWIPSKKITAKHPCSWDSQNIVDYQHQFY